MRDNVSLGDGVLIHDNTGIPKQGDHSVGVARQYCSVLAHVGIRKVANCQVLVTCHYADPAASWPVNARLYLPSKWTDDADRMREAGVPVVVTLSVKKDALPIQVFQLRSEEKPICFMFGLWNLTRVCILGFP